MKLKALLGIAFLLTPSLAAQEIPRRKTLVRVVDQEGKPLPGVAVLLQSSGVPGVRVEDRVEAKTGKRGGVFVGLEEGRSYTAWGLLKDAGGEPVVQTRVMEEVRAGTPVLLRVQEIRPLRFPLRVSMLRFWKDFAPIRVVAKSPTKNPIAFPVSLDARGRARLPVIPGGIPRLEFYDKEQRLFAFWEMDTLGRTQFQALRNARAINPKLKGEMGLLVALRKPVRRLILVQDEEGAPIQGAEVYLWNNLGSSEMNFDFGGEPRDLSRFCRMGETNARGELSVVVPEGRRVFGTRLTQTMRKIVVGDKEPHLQDYLLLPMVLRAKGKAIRLLGSSFFSEENKGYKIVLNEGNAPRLEFTMRAGATFKGQILSKGVPLPAGVPLLFRSRAGTEREGWHPEAFPWVRGWTREGGGFAFEGLMKGDSLLLDSQSPKAGGNWAYFGSMDPGKSLVLDLKKLPELHLSISGPGGQPAGSTRIFLGRDFPGPLEESLPLFLSGTADRHGSWRLRINPGRYSYFLHHPRMGWAYGSCEVQAGSSPKLSLNLSAFAKHSGTIVNARGRPLKPGITTLSLVHEFMEGNENDDLEGNENDTGFFREVLSQILPPFAENLLKPDGSFDLAWIPLPGLRGKLELSRLTFPGGMLHKELELTSEGFKNKKIVLSPYSK
ncbi:MAG TPA: hypothetical protein ENK02_04440 [Planctomycetes bacterium]|nr:hypothetical protein [Planctomycetota bacterium]